MTDLHGWSVQPAQDCGFIQSGIGRGNGRRGRYYNSHDGGPGAARDATNGPCSRVLCGKYGTSGIADTIHDSHGLHECIHGHELASDGDSQVSICGHHAISPEESAHEADPMGKS